MATGCRHPSLLMDVRFLACPKAFTGMEVGLCYL